MPAVPAFQRFQYFLFYRLPNWRLQFSQSLAFMNFNLDELLPGLLRATNDLSAKPANIARKGAKLWQASEGIGFYSPLTFSPLGGQLEIRAVSKSAPYSTCDQLIATVLPKRSASITGLVMRISIKRLLFTTSIRQAKFRHYTLDLSRLLFHSTCQSGTIWGAKFIPLIVVHWLCMAKTLILLACY